MSGKSKLSPETQAWVKASPLRTADLAKQLGVHPVTIYRLRPNYKRTPIGRTTEESRAIIRASDLPIEELAVLYGLHKSTIRRLQNTEPKTSGPKQKALNPIHIEVARLYNQENWTLSQISRKFKIPVMTVWSIKQRALGHKPKDYRLLKRQREARKAALCDTLLPASEKSTGPSSSPSLITPEA